MFIKVFWGTVKPGTLYYDLTPCSLQFNPAPCALTHCTSFFISKNKVLVYYRYDPDTDRWTYVSSMATKRIGVGVGIVNRLMYAVGGFDGANRLRSVECYDPEKDEWHFVAPMNSTRSGAGTCYSIILFMILGDLVVWE